MSREALLDLEGYLSLGPRFIWTKAKVLGQPKASSIWPPLPHSPAGEQTQQAVQTVGLKTFAAAAHQSSVAAGSSAVAGSFGNFAAVGNSEVVAAGNSGTSAAALAFSSLHLGSPAPERSSYPAA